MIKVFYGPMFSGKTKVLIKEFLSKYEFTKKDEGVYEWFRPKIDTRSEGLYARNFGKKIKIKCHSITNLEEIDNYISEKTKSIYIDEGNFLKGDPEYLFKLSIKGYNESGRGIDVYVAGLVLDRFQLPFGIMPGILTYATDVVALKARCVYCGEDAPFTYNLFDSEGQIVVGNENEGYESVCEECLSQKRKEKGQNLIDAKYEKKKTVIR